LNLKKIKSHRLAEAISKMRLGDLEIKPGFDGQYGQIKIF
jgi:hypothetical protein